MPIWKLEHSSGLSFGKHTDFSLKIEKKPRVNDDQQLGVVKRTRITMVVAVHFISRTKVSDQAI